MFIEMLLGEGKKKQKKLRNIIPYQWTEYLQA
jgi:hypothetical protein